MHAQTKQHYVPLSEHFKYKGLECVIVVHKGVF